MAQITVLMSEAMNQFSNETSLCFSDVQQFCSGFVWTIFGEIEQKQTKLCQKCKSFKINLLLFLHLNKHYADIRERQHSYSCDTGSRQEMTKKGVHFNFPLL